MILFLIILSFGILEIGAHTNCTNSTKFQIENCTIVTKEITLSIEKSAEHATVYMQEDEQLNTKFLKPPENVASKTGTYNDDDSSVVQTSGGPVRGVLGAGMKAFYDVPYGRINQTFQEPLEPPTWTEIREVTQHKSRCPQIQELEVTGNLDCLTLSVFAPDTGTAAPSPVLFHVYDGEFSHGSADPTKYVPDNLVARGIIVVLPNYRLGPLGFACLRNNAVPGNAGLKDLTLALNWTATNIAAFGGDPTNIVVSGEGLAGSLAGYLAISPLSVVYINKAITESGSLLSDWAIDRNPTDTVIKLVRTILDNDSATDTDALLSLDVTTLIQHSLNIQFRPCVENNSDGFLPETPWKMLHDSPKRIQHMIGTAAHAGYHDALRFSDENSFVPSDLHFDNVETKRKIIDKVALQYFKDQEIGSDISALSLLYTDGHYLSPTIRAARALAAAGSDIYVYEFSYEGQLNVESEALGQTTTGAVRGDLLGYLFTRLPLVEDMSRDALMVEFLTDLWSGFIHNGTPLSSGLAWTKFTATDELNENWLSIGPIVSQIQGIHLDRLPLWTRIYNDYFIDKNKATIIQPMAIIFLSALLL